MHIYVCIKQTPASSSVYIDPISGQIDTERFVQILNPADACAVEAAVRLKELFGATITALTLGPEDADGALRAALALGVDSSIRLYHPQADAWNPFNIASALAAYIQQAAHAPDLVLCGDASSDWASNTVGPALACYLNLPQLTSVTQLSASGKPGKIVLQITRKLEHGYRELLEAELPLLLTVTATLNEPRYPSLPAHIAALKARLPIIDLQTFLPSARQQLNGETTLLEIHMPRPRPRHISAPASTHSAYQRIGEIIAGGTTGRQTQLAEGSPAELARILVTFLRERSFM